MYNLPNNNLGTFWDILSTINKTGFKIYYYTCSGFTQEKCKMVSKTTES